MALLPPLTANAGPVGPLMLPAERLTLPLTLLRLTPVPVLFVDVSVLKVQPPVVVFVTSSAAPPVAFSTLLEPGMLTVPLLLASSARALVVVMLTPSEKLIVPLLVSRLIPSSVWPVPVIGDPPLKVTLLLPVRLWMS